MKKSVFKKTGFMLGVGFAIFITVMAGFLCVDAIDTFAGNELKEANFCSFVVPNEFIPGDAKGLFINKNHPMESSSIMYSHYDNGADVVLTNREKAALKEAGQVQPQVTDESQNLTMDIYQETMSAAYNSAYGQDVGFAVSSFSRITVDGYPGYKIVGSFKATDEEVVHQTVYMLLSKYRTFTITYQRAEDDDCEEMFEESAATIQVGM